MLQIEKFYNECTSLSQLRRTFIDIARSFSETRIWTRCSIDERNNLRKASRWDGGIGLTSQKHKSEIIGNSNPFSRRMWALHCQKITKNIFSEIDRWKGKGCMAHTVIALPICSIRISSRSNFHLTWHKPQRSVESAKMVDKLEIGVSMNRYLCW